MRCQHCGNELADDAKFCKNCGAKVEAVVEEEPTPVQPVTPPPHKEEAPTFNAQPEPPKKSGIGKVLIIILIICGVLFGGCTLFTGCVACSLFGSDDTEEKKEEKKEEEKKEEEKKEEEETKPATIDELFEGYSFGALYQGDVVQYGPASMTLPGYHLETMEPNDGSGTQYYLVNDGDEVTSIFYVMSQPENNVSYTNTKESDIRDSYTEDAGWTEVTMLYFNKTKLGNYPCISYAASAKLDGNFEYIFEIIIFDKDYCSRTVRLLGEAGTEDAYNKMKGCFETTKLASNPIRFDDTNTTNESQITVK